MTNKTTSIILHWLWRLLKAAVVIAIIGGIVYWVRFQPVSIIEHEVVRGDVVAEVMGTGTLEARVKATISPKISGRIEEVIVDQGDRVSTGELLVRLDDDELRQQVAIAEADVETKQAAIVRLNSDITRSSAILSQAKTNHQRLSSLSLQNAISRDELDKAAESLAIAESETSRSQAALAEGRKALIVSERSLEFQETKLEDSLITAPFDGLIVRRERDPGDVVVPGSTILSLISTEELWISAWVDETEMARLKSGQDARVIFRSESETALPGKLVRLGKETDRETREFVVDVAILKLPQNWAVGQRAEVFVETSEKTQVVLVPNRFISRLGQESGVFVDREGVVGWQSVEIGLRGRETVEVVSGLKTGDSVVLSKNPNQQLRAGQRIARE